VRVGADGERQALHELLVHFARQHVLRRRCSSRER
jgi:hypothetical protein